MRSFIVAALLLACGSSSADPETPEISRRTLNGHRFTQSLMIADPFVSSNVSLQAGAGSTFLAGARALPQRLDTQGWIAGFQLGLLPFFALRLSGSADIYHWKTGSLDAWRVSPGTTLSWQVADWLRVGLVIDFDYRTVGALRYSGRIESFTLQPGVALAIAASRAIGLTFTAQHQWERLDNHVITVDNSRIALAAAIDVDLKPVSILLAWRGQIPVLSEVSGVHELEVGLHYTGRDWVTLGLVVRTRWLDVVPDQPVASVTGNLVARYYWN